VRILAGDFLRYVLLKHWAATLAVAADRELLLATEERLAFGPMVTPVGGDDLRPFPVEVSDLFLPVPTAIRGPGKR